ncbi:hypothetical protein ACFLXC_02875 [Chloroflexota bacterium]
MPTPNPHILKHDNNYNAIVMYVGTDPENPEELVGEIEFEISGEKLMINRTVALSVPPGCTPWPVNMEDG